MPRIPPLLLRQTQASDGLLARLLPVCRELTAAQNELRWLREHATATKDDLHELVLRRARGEPLQYILRTEYFGGLEIVCRPGVLIPRQETAASLSYLVQHRLPQKKRLRVLDLCTGTGCIPLLFHHEYHKQYSGELDLIGIDVSDTALDLARENHQRQLSTTNDRISAHSLQQLQFLKGDVLTGVGLPRGPFDVLISNPPYISQHDFKTVTAGSVRQYEPKLALVPPPGDTTVADGDQFYPHLWRIADEVNASTVLFEIGDAAQAERVAQMGTKHHWDQIELWRDEPNKKSEHGLFQTIGEGNMRSVFARRLSRAG